jgi:hypothetical protein
LQPLKTIKIGLSKKVHKIVFEIGFCGDKKTFKNFQKKHCGIKKGFYICTRLARKQVE